jgi:hypothetical protein
LDGTLSWCIAQSQGNMPKPLIMAPLDQQDIACTQLFAEQGYGITKIAPAHINLFP